MPNYQYLIIGGGMAADAAVKGIREVDQKGSIGVVSCETSPPYKRPPLTKQLWKGKPEDTIWLHTADSGAMLHLGRLIKSVDLRNKTAVDESGTEYAFEKLLLATGGKPRRLPFGPDDVIYYRFFDDYRTLRKLTEQYDSFAVIGGGFIGSEIAAALAMNGKKVTIIFPQRAIGDRIYPIEIAEYLNDYYTQKGVFVLKEDNVTGIEKRGAKTAIHLESGTGVEADAVIAGIGITPRVELAEAAGIKVDNGIIVDNLLRTDHPDVYAAGDAANFYNPLLDKRLRVEHEDNAVSMGRYVGKTMAGSDQPYDYLPYFYSDLFELGYEAVGELDSRMETFADWKEPFKEGVIYYLRDGRVRGVLLWNVWDKVPTARELIAEQGPFTPENLKGRITN